MPFDPFDERLYESDQSSDGIRMARTNRETFNKQKEPWIFGAWSRGAGMSWEMTASQARAMGLDLDLVLQAYHEVDAAHWG